jgi:hypothetical protein
MALPMRDALSKFMEQTHNMLSGLIITKLFMRKPVKT